MPITSKKYIYNITIINVIDGDTILCNIDLGFKMMLWNWTIRLDGIDTPEIHSTDPLEVQAGNVVRNIIKGMLPSESETILESTTKPDKYGRVLGRIQNSMKSMWINDYLITRKLAKEYHGEKKSPWTTEELTYILGETNG